MECSWSIRYVPDRGRIRPSGGNRVTRLPANPSSYETRNEEIGAAASERRTLQVNGGLLSLPGTRRWPSFSPGFSPLVVPLVVHYKRHVATRLRSEALGAIIASFGRFPSGRL
jgi:hypothetical protein